MNKQSVVVDTSTVICALLPHDKRCNAAMTRLMTGDSLHAPTILDFEVLSVLRRLSFSDPCVTEESVAQMLDWLGQMPIRRVDMDRGLADRTFAHRKNLTAYDASFVALAEIMGATLITTDLKLAGSPGLGCAVEAIA